MDGVLIKSTQAAASGLRRLKLAMLLGAIGIALSGCVVYPSAYSEYGYGGYYAAPAYVAPAYVAPPVVVGGWGWGRGWGRGWGGGRDWR